MFIIQNAQRPLGRDIWLSGPACGGHQRRADFRDRLFGFVRELCHFNLLLFNSLNPFFSRARDYKSLFFHMSFSRVALVAHLKNTMTYLPPAKYIPVKN